MQNPHVEQVTTTAIENGHRLVVEHTLYGELFEAAEIITEGNTSHYEIIGNSDVAGLSHLSLVPGMEVYSRAALILIGALEAQMMEDAGI